MFPTQRCVESDSNANYSDMNISHCVIYWKCPLKIKHCFSKFTIPTSEMNVSDEHVHLTTSLISPS